MANESQSESWFVLKPIQFRGRVWAIYEWVTILFFVSLTPVFFIPLYFSLFEFIIALALIGYFQARTEDVIFKLDSTKPSENPSESKLPSKEEATQWAKKNSEYFMAWNKRQYKASKSWFGQKREDWAEWRHQRKMARYQIVAMPDQGVITAVDQVMDSTKDALEDDAMAKMLDVDPELETAEEHSEETEIQTIVIPLAPTFTSVQKPVSTPRGPLVDRDRVPMYLRRATRMFYSLLISFYALAMLNSAYEMGLFDFFYSDFVVERLLGEYPGTEVGLKPRAVILSTLFLCTSLLMLIGYRPFVTIFILHFALTMSILMRLDIGDLSTLGSAYLVKDIIWSLLFVVFCSITFFTKEPDMTDSLLGPQELISASDQPSSGRTMDDTTVIRPKRPPRRARPLFFYEGFFLIIAIALWPISLFSMIALASADLRETWALPADFDSGSTTGQMLLAVLFSLCLMSTYIVYRFDREARDHPMYDKEMEAYVKSMEHWISINADKYARAHARLTHDLPGSSDEE